MRDHEQLSRLVRIRLGVERPGVVGALHAESRPTEDEEIEVELARAPATAPLATERALQALEPGQQVEGAARRVRAGRDIERDDRVMEIGLVA